ncbi:MAG: histidinol-phosphate transaminase [Armatimonadetes bacterium]|nr:histidinol-phosphate transaminase [Armatimonadota bacterium]
MTATRSFIRPNILDLTPYRPGKPIEEVQREYGIQDVVKMASNENPLGPSPKAVAAMEEAVRQVGLYPDGNCFYLKEDLARYWKVSAEEIILGNGSDEIIHYLGVAFMNPGEEVILADPTFVRYESAAILNNCACIKVPLKNHTYDLAAMADRITDRTKMIFIANPNNPTGTMVTRQEVDALMNRVPEGVLTVFDEAYYEYVESPAYPDTLNLVREGRDVIVLRTFSKIYALAGLRIGYGIARPEIIHYLNQVREPFNVSLVAQAAARASLRDPGQVARSRKANAEGKRFLCQGFEAIGLEYAPSEANFIWVNTGKDSREVFEALIHRGVIVRTGDIFGWPTYIRVTMGTPDENRRFIEALRSVLGQ